MPPSPRPRTLLALLLIQHRWTVEQFCDAYATAAADAGVKVRSVSDRTVKRWLAGSVSRPYPAACRVLDHMFDVDAERLLAPPPEPTDTGPLALSAPVAPAAPYSGEATGIPGPFPRR
jgi:hypothetical protein